VSGGHGAWDHPATGKLTRIDLEEDISALGHGRYKARVLVRDLFDLVAVGLREDGEVKISGFGTFNVREKSARAGRDPHRNVAMTLAARRVVVFRPSPRLRDQLTGALPEDS
jgi:integration host factor subunit alpha